VPPLRPIYAGEVVVVEVAPHWLAIAGPLTAAVLVVGVAVGLDVGFPRTSVDLHWVEALAAAVPLAWFVVRFVRWRRTSLVITSVRLVGRSGVVTRREWEIPLAEIERVDAMQPFLQRLVGAGWIELTLTGGRGVRIVEDVRKPAVVQRVVSRRIPPPAPDRRSE